MPIRLRVQRTFPFAVEYHPTPLRALVIKPVELPHACDRNTDEALDRLRDRPISRRKT